MLLRSVFITLLRGIGVFNATLLADHCANHFNCNFVPYTLGMREKFIRLIASTCQFDIYFSLAHKKPPLLHCQEVGANLTSTFAVWNAHGLDVLADRLLEEPTERSQCPISAITKRLGSPRSSPLLVEDVLLGLGGVLQEIWVWRQPLSLRMNLIEAINAWTVELDRINELADMENITDDAARCLVLAYRGEDDSLAAALERIATLVQDGRILSYYLKMYHYASFGSSEFVHLVKTGTGSRTETWRTTKFGREALMCALQMLKLAEGSGPSSNPLIGPALDIAADLIRRVLVSCEKCQCVGSQGLSIREPDLQEWTRIGGPLYIDSTSVCVCTLVYWTARFKKAIKSQQAMMEPAISIGSSCYGVQ